MKFGEDGSNCSARRNGCFILHLSVSFEFYTREINKYIHKRAREHTHIHQYKPVQSFDNVVSLSYRLVHSSGAVYSKGMPLSHLSSGGLPPDSTPAQVVPVSYRFSEQRACPLHFKVVSSIKMSLTFSDCSYTLKANL